MTPEEIALAETWLVLFENKPLDNREAAFIKAARFGLMVLKNREERGPDLTPRIVSWPWSD